MVLEKTLKSPWTARRSNQSILKEIIPECLLEGLMLILRLQYFGHLVWRANSFKKTLLLGKIEGGEGDDRGWDGWMASPTQWTWVWVNSGSWWWTGRPVMLQSMGSQRVRHEWATELNWTCQVYKNIIKLLGYSPTYCQQIQFFWDQFLKQNPGVFPLFYFRQHLCVIICKYCYFNSSC